MARLIGGWGSLVVALGVSLGGGGEALGGEFEFKIGPSHFDSGGSNPVLIPPGVSDVDVTYITKASTEFGFAVPASVLGVGHRFTSKPTGPYISAGGGIGITRAGGGLGPYFALGSRSSWFVIEFKQGFFMDGDQLSTPAALRFGIRW